MLIVDHLRRRAAADRDPGQGPAPAGRGRLRGAARRTCGRERGVRALLCEGGPHLHAQLIERRPRRRAVRHPCAAKLAGGAGPGLVAGLAERERPLELAWLLAEEATGELFGRYRTARASRSPDSPAASTRRPAEARRAAPPRRGRSSILLGASSRSPSSHAAGDEPVLERAERGLEPVAAANVALAPPAPSPGRSRPSAGARRRRARRGCARAGRRAGAASAACRPG